MTYTLQGAATTEMNGRAKMYTKFGVTLGSQILSAARDTFDRAQYDVSRTLLRAVNLSTERDAGEIALLSARASRALGDNDAWFASASDAVRDLEPGGSLARALALRASAAKALGRARDAKTSGDEAAHALLRLSGVPGGAARLELALDAFEHHDYTRAELLLKENVAAGAEEAASTALLGWVELKRERFPEASRFFSGALRKLHASGDVDVALEAHTLAGLATVSAEMADLKALDRVREAFLKAPLPEALRADRFAILMGLRYGSLLENDTSAAFFEAREAASVAPTSADRGLAEVNAAVSTVLVGDRNSEQLHFGRAWDVLRAETWTGSDETARIALLTFAAEAARILPGESRKAMTHYRALAQKVGAAGGVPSDRRTLALESLASARIAEAQADEISAERLYQKAFDIFRALRCDMRAALVALDLRRITGDNSYVEAIDAVLERAPGAWFGAQLAAQNGPLGRLSPAELIVLARLIRGETAKTIGEKLGRSPFTISNHTRRIFQAFDVNSRSKVIAGCAELGITPEHVERVAR